ncbi:NAD(P)-dependent oxidoreductase [Shewanella intestini]|uniref:NAD(P)-dependent oxidoreductase n=1 Tax=Shewanella intestini TaxID=2017544 RepID=A0ABS5I180_9GAMM|nr:MULTISPECIES: NAD(P)-dependent oxidoreductase [Shewanella]MBR9727770.1 NAD(P)-dependent oxidoreductase [Shewanella intestini]MRG36237.1 NAD-binding protein [Shewanella sp. XMDDZSB0408]
MAKVAFIGLGVMGYPMAGFLQNNGHEVTVFNRTQSKALQWVKQYGGESAVTPKAAATGKDIVFTCVGNDDDLRQVVVGDDGVIHSMSAGSILVDHTTASADVARELAATLQLSGVHFMDAPISGGQAGAENGVLTVMMGGSEQDFNAVKPVISVYSRCAQLLGDVGAGQLTKMVNQICIAGAVQGLAEGLHFARSAGLDGPKVVDVISKGAAQSWQMENRYQTMWDGEYDFGFAIDWMRKDLGIALTEARKNGSHLPITALVDQFYSELQSMDANRWDTSSLLARLEKTRK